MGEQFGAEDADEIVALRDVSALVRYALDVDPLR